MKRPLFDLRTIAEVEGAGVKAGKHAEWKEQIIVPPLPQSALAGCSLIDIEYFIQVGPSHSSHLKGKSNTDNLFGKVHTGPSDLCDHQMFKATINIFHWKFYLGFVFTEIYRMYGEMHLSRAK